MLSRTTWLTYKKKKKFNKKQTINTLYKTTIKKIFVLKTFFFLIVYGPGVYSFFTSRNVIMLKTNALKNTANVQIFLRTNGSFFFFSTGKCTHDNSFVIFHSTRARPPCLYYRIIIKPNRDEVHHSAVPPSP